MQRGPIGPLCMSAILPNWPGFTPPRRPEIAPPLTSIMALSESKGCSSYYVANIYDITASKTIFDEVSWLASFDPLTQLPNRRTLQERATRELSIAVRSGLKGAVLFLDLDNFKSINDTRGHSAGDSLLIEAGQRLRSAVRKEDIVARMGGDEFVALLTDLSANPEWAAYQAKTIGEKILAALARHYQFPGYEFNCPASMGIVMFSGGESVDELLQHADLAMYEAKKPLSGGLRFFDKEMQAAATSHTFMEQELSRITMGDQLELYFQPQINAKGQIESAEGLLRWHHPELGLVMPADFIPVAEESGLILPIGQWVLETACAQLKAWERNPLTQQLRLAVNVSVRQFAQPDFEDSVLKTISESGIEPKRLMLELTESMMHEAADTAAKMNRLREIGITFSLDDFGTGYSSLSVLTQLPLEQLKIAQSFVSDVMIKEPAATIIETIIGMGRNLGLSVIAEGVQTEEQWAFLKSKGCTHFQGYLFSPPLEIGAFEAMALTNFRTPSRENDLFGADS
jgi:diguanylate cyclase (GGDEF)-like protein